MIKNVFIRQFRGKTWDEKLIRDQSTPTQENTTDSSEGFDNADNLTPISDLIRTSSQLFEKSKAFKEKRPSLKLYLKKSIELLNESISIDESILRSSVSNNQEKSNAEFQLKHKIEFRALIYLDMAKKYDFPCFEKFNCFNQSKYDFYALHEVIKHNVATCVFTEGKKKANFFSDKIFYFYF